MDLLLLADIQGNLAALEAVLEHPAARRADAVLALGDLASGPNPAEVLERLRRRGGRAVRGNMDAVLAAPPPPGEADGDARRFAEIDVWGSERLGRAQRRWLASLPLGIEVDLPCETRLFACHGSPGDPEGVLGAATPDDEVRALLANVAAGVVATGHLHEPMLRRLDDRLLIHPGSVGWPKPDRNGKRPLRAEFAVLRGSADGPGVTFYHQPYPAEALRRAVLASGMPHGAWYLQGWREVHR